jgi:phosphonoacetaldehyde hydrolase
MDTQPIKAVVFDWAGTVVDHGSWAPVLAFMDVFHKRGIELALEDVRRYMGMAKREHIRIVFELPYVRNAWRAQHGTAPGIADVDQLYAEFLEFQAEAIAEHSALIDGVPEMIHLLREAGLRIGTTTGYPRPIMERLVPIARQAGFDPDMVVTVDDVPAGRPAPWMILRNAEAFGIYPFSQLVVVDDTVAGIEAGVHAGCRTVGISRTGNLVGMGQREFEQLPEAQQLQKLRHAEQQFRAAGADAVLPTVAELPNLLATWGLNLPATQTL